MDKIGLTVRSLLVVVIISICYLTSAGLALAQTAIRGETVYTMAGTPIKDGVVLVRKGKIEQIGTAAQITIPKDYQTLNAKVVTPGLIDAHSVVGLSGYLNQPHDQDQIEKSSAIQPELRAIDAYNAREFLVEWLRSFGVTTLHTGHAPGVVISGQTLVAKTSGGTVDKSVIVPIEMIAATMGEAGLNREGKGPGTRAKLVAVLRSEFIKAQEYLKKSSAKSAEDRPDRDLKTEALVKLLKGEVPLLVTVHRAQDILAAIRLAKEFHLRLVLDGASESYLVIDEIKAAGCPVIIHPTMMRSYGETENASMETAAKLMQAGILVALQSGYEEYVPKTRVVLYEAAIAAANGLTFDQALATVTINAARILGLDKRIGSLEVGKDADIVLFDGDPFEYTSHVTGVLIEGEQFGPQR